MCEIVLLVKIFFDSFDSKDWSQMKNCLADELELDYSSFRGTPPYISSSEEYIEKRTIGMQGLQTKHHSSDYKVTNSGEEYHCTCQFKIKRFAESWTEQGDDYFHSYGKYEIGLSKIEGRLRIFRIKQILDRNEGNPQIHGAFRT